MTSSDDRHEVHIAAQPGDGRTRVLKRNELFAVVDEHGDIVAAGRRGALGLYLADTRHLSELVLRIQGRRPLLLSAHVDGADTAMRVDLTNAEFETPEGTVAGDTLHLHRHRALVANGWYERITLHNYGERRTALDVTLTFDADFVDLFEVRGVERAVRGSSSAELEGPDRVCLSYRGLDAVVRTTALTFAPCPRALDTRQARWRVEVEPGQSVELTVTIECRGGLDGRSAPADASLSVDAALTAGRRDPRDAPDWPCVVSTSNAIFNEWVLRSRDDLLMLTTDTPYGPYPYAGTPWYSTAFGRDGLITALQVLAFEPRLAVGVLRYLAARQAESFDELRDAEPGKILHESRLGEMARLGEVPFRCYYGSIDSTPLFVLLAGETLRRTGDRALMRELWPNLVAATRWIDEYGDRDGDGYVEYGRRNPQGLVQQGWKDSHDSVFHADGRDAPGPIALCEVQAYVYGARHAMADIAEALGELDVATAQRARAEKLRKQFERDFWLDDVGFYALALDGNKEPCRVITSNVGHLLLTGIADPERAARMVPRLFDDALYSGWGIRTLAAGQPRFSPLSYHNGSIWPHDNAVIALGLSRYGFGREAARLLEDLFMAATNFDLRRLPELFCGFRRVRGQSPTRYPVACSPQAWAAGSVFVLLQAALGIVVSAPDRCVYFHAPQLPASLDTVVIAGLSVGEGSIDIRLHRHHNDTVVEVVRRDAGITVEIRK